MDNWEEYLDENERKTTRDGGCAGAVLADRYRMVRRLGEGGMGSVLLAEGAQLDNLRVAIKMLPSFLVANKRAYMRLKKEALVSLKLSHPRRRRRPSRCSRRSPPRWTTRTREASSTAT